MFKVFLTAAFSFASQLVLGASLAITLADNNGNAVEDAVAYIKSIDGKPVPAQPLEMAVDQIDEAFVPHVRAATTGSRISFPNSDHIRHHVYSFSAARSFELPLYIGIPAEPVVFDTAGIVTLGCNIHDHMLGYILIVDSPFFVEIKNGYGLISEVPPGELIIEIWHPRLASESPIVHTLKLGPEEQAQLVASLELRPERMVRRAPRRNSTRY